MKPELAGRYETRTLGSTLQFTGLVLKQAIFQNHVQEVISTCMVLYLSHGLHFTLMSSTNKIMGPNSHFFKFWVVLNPLE